MGASFQDRAGVPSGLSRQSVSGKAAHPSRITDDLVADALDAQRKEFNAWQIIPCRSCQPDDIHMVAKIYTSLEYVPAGVEVTEGTFPIERYHLSNQEMAEEYVAHQAMRAAIAHVIGKAA